MTVTSYRASFIPIRVTLLLKSLIRGYLITIQWINFGVK